MTRRILLVDIGSGLTLSGVLPSVALHGAYSARLIARGGAVPYVFALTAGELPTGLFLDPATGIISGTADAAGVFGFTVRVTDLSGAYVDRAFGINVIAEPLTLSGVFEAGQTLATYSSALLISGGAPPYVNPRVTAGSLPNGLALSISDDTLVLSGTPTAANTYAFSVAVDSSDGATAESDQSVEVSSGIDPIALSIYNKLSAAGTYWDLSESSGVRADGLGRKPLTPSGAGTVTTADGPRGAGDPAANFVGAIGLAANSLAGDVLSIPNGGGNHCCFGWFYSTDASAQQILSGLGNAGSSGTHFSQLLGTSLYGENANPTVTFATVARPAINTWHFIVYWRDAADGKVRLSLNDGVVAVSAAASNPAATNTTFFLGASSSTGTVPLKGRESRWGYIRGDFLTPTEITWMMNASMGRNWAEIVAAAGH